MKRSISLVFATLGLSLSTQSSALTIITLGGATGDAMQSAYFTPFVQSTGHGVTAGEYNEEISRIRAMVETDNLGVVWSGSIYDLDYWAIVQGSGQLDTVYEFISFASQPEGQALFSQQISYGPVHPEAIAGLEFREALRMPTHEDNLKNALGINTDFWVDYGEELEQRFNAWAAR